MSLDGHARLPPGETPVGIQGVVHTLERKKKISMDVIKPRDRKTSTQGTNEPGGLAQKAGSLQDLREYPALPVPRIVVDRIPLPQQSTGGSKQPGRLNEQTIRSIVTPVMNLLQQMMKTLQKNKGVNDTIKHGLPRIIDALDQVLDLAHAPSGRGDEPMDVTAASAKRTRPDASDSDEGAECSPQQLKKTRPEEQVDFQTVEGRKNKQAAKRAQQLEQQKMKQQQQQDEARRQKAQQEHKQLRPPLAQGQPSASPPAKQEKEPAQKQATKKKKKRAPRKRTQAIVIKPAQGKSFADVLKDVHGDFTKEKPATDIKCIRKTRGGDVLVELASKPGDEEFQAFSQKIRQAVGQNGAVRQLTPKTSVEVRNLTAEFTTKDVNEALENAFKELTTEAVEAKVTLTNPNNRGMRLAIIEMDQDKAELLLSKQRLHVGYISCPVRRWERIQRCFRCLDYGHQARDCHGPDRSRTCYKCGTEGHKGSACQVPAARCILCTERKVNPAELNHTPGSGKCKAFRETLNRLRQKH
jgi:type II secretory pathway pseudopilin PulG